MASDVPVWFERDGNTAGPCPMDVDALALLIGGGKFVLTSGPWPWHEKSAQDTRRIESVRWQLIYAPATQSDLPTEHIACIVTLGPKTHPRP